MVFLILIFHFLSPGMECVLKIIGNDFSVSPRMECMLKIIGNDFSVSPWMEWQKTAPRQLLLGNCSMRYPTTVLPVHMHCPTTTTTDGGSADIAGANICPSIRPTWMWEVWKMQGAIFNHRHMHFSFCILHYQT